MKISKKGPVLAHINKIKNVYLGGKLSFKSIMTILSLSLDNQSCNEISSLSTSRVGTYFFSLLLNKLQDEAQRNGQKAEVQRISRIIAGT